MSNFAIVTDSAGDLSPEMIHEAQIPVLPLGYTIEEATYADAHIDRESSCKEFYDKLCAGHTATTNAVNITAYTETLTPLLEMGKDVLIIAFSSGLSSTYSSAMIAADMLMESYPERKVFVSDSFAASMGQGLLVLLAIKERESGKSAEEVHQWVEKYKFHICHQFTVDDLNYLKRGGRISGVTAAIGTALAIKPVLHLDNDGRLTSIHKVRGRKASLRTLVEKMQATAFTDIEQTIYISHGDCLSEAMYVAELVKEAFPNFELCLGNVGPVIGAHTGPSVVAVFYQGTSR